MIAPDTRVLVVDDMMTMRKLVRKILTSHGISQITEADNGSTAWQKIEEMQTAKTPFQLILCDWNMPQMTGIELLKKVRSTPPHTQLTFVLLTAESDKDQVVEAAKLKVSGYVIKPFNDQMLMEKINALMIPNKAAA